MRPLRNGGVTWDGAAPPPSYGNPLLTADPRVPLLAAQRGPFGAELSLSSISLLVRISKVFPFLDMLSALLLPSAIV